MVFRAEEVLVGEEVIDEERGERAGRTGCCSASRSPSRRVGIDVAVALVADGNWARWRGGVDEALLVDAVGGDNRWLGTGK